MEYKYRMELLQASLWKWAKTLDADKLEKILNTLPSWAEQFDKIVSHDFLEYAHIRSWKNWRRKYLDNVGDYLLRKGLTNFPEHREYLEELYLVFFKGGQPIFTTEQNANIHWAIFVYGWFVSPLRTALLGKK